MGGEQAAGDPQDAARAILRLIEERPTAASDAVFVNHLGEAMGCIRIQKEKGEKDDGRFSATPNH